MESKGTTVVASCIHQALTDSHRYTTLTDATAETGLTLGQWRLKNCMESAAELFKTSDNIERYAAAY